MWVCVLIAKENPIVEVLRERGREYADRARGQRPAEHKMGPPCVHLMEALLWHLVDAARTEVPQEVRDRLRTLYDKMSTELKVAQQMTRYLRYKETYDRRHFKVTFHLKSNQDEADLLDALVAMGAEHLPSTPPQGGLEWVVSDWLNGRW